MKRVFQANESEPRLDKARIAVGPESGVPLQPIKINVQNGYTAFSCTVYNGQPAKDRDLPIFHSEIIVKI
jgi:hypothetical protein